jgi:hypothetical protein
MMSRMMMMMSVPIPIYMSGLIPSGRGTKASEAVVP